MHMSASGAGHTLARHMSKRLMRCWLKETKLCTLSPAGAHWNLGWIATITIQATGCLCAQGEMVQAKFGMPAVAGRQMEVFSTAVLLATQSPPSSPRKPEWRAHMERMSAISCEAYRDVRACPLKSTLSAGGLQDEGVS